MRKYSLPKERYYFACYHCAQCINGNGENLSCNSVREHLTILIFGTTICGDWKLYKELK